MGRGLRLASCHFNDVFRLGYDASDTFKVNEARMHYTSPACGYQVQHEVDYQSRKSSTQANMKRAITSGFSDMAPRRPI